MSEPKQISPLLDEFRIGDAVSEHHGVRCCPAIRGDAENRYILKVISVPSSQTRVDALLLAGVFPDKESTLDYFRAQAEEIAQEAEVLSDLSQVEGFLGYEGTQIVPMEDGTGFDVYAIGPYRRTLERTIRKGRVTALNAVNLGLDLCAALSVCRRSGYLYVDLKPENIAIADNGEYRICDLGFVKTSELGYYTLPDRYISAYTAPEIQDASSPLNASMDIYAVGMILYQLYNNNVLPFTGRAPATALEPPANADEEMAAILAKACDPDPANRWASPTEFGQALVNYMQTVGANDVPIAPPAPEPPAQEEASAEVPGGEDDSTEAVLAVVDMALEQGGPASAPAAPDDTVQAPEGERTEVDVSEMLAQADDLIAHETPEPAVAPEAIEIPMPAPIVPEKPAEEAAEESPAEPDAVPEAGESSAEPADVPEPKRRARRKPRKKHTGLIVLLILLLLLAAGLYGAHYYYENIYLQPVLELELVGSQDALTVSVNCALDDSELVILCTDSYGNTLRQTPVDGQTTFTDLRANTRFTISVEPTGFHKLIGVTSESYTSPEQSSIVNISIVTGAEDSSVVLSFSVQGTDSDEWTVSYSAEGEEDASLTFTGHTVRLSGLSVGKTYTFALTPVDALYMVGENTATFTVTGLYQAVDLTIEGFHDGSLYVSWSDGGSPVEAWTVRCYNGDDYDVTMTVSECAAVFDDTDPASAYTIEVLAAGMTVSSIATVSADSVTVSDFAVDDSSGELAITWSYEGTDPEGGWLLLYTIDDCAVPLVVDSDEPSAAISLIIPGAQYSFELYTANGATVFSGTGEYTAAEAENFSGYLLDISNFSFTMCRTPEKSDWTMDDVADEDITTEFVVGESAAFGVQLRHVYSTTSEAVVTLFVIRNADGSFVRADTQTRAWNSMWRQNFGRMVIPVMPDEAGEYTVTIYLAGMYLTEQAFTVVDE